MAQYKKKRVNKLRGTPKPKKVNRHEYTNDDNIEMYPSDSKSNEKKKVMQSSESNMRVVKGNKLERQRKTKVFLLFASVIVVICLILHFILPIGVLENIQNITSVIGSGGYPTQIQSSEVLSSSTKGMYYYVLTDTKINAYSNSGKEIYSYSHGFEKPIMKTSKTRALIFSQGGNDLLIYNLSSLKNTHTTENEIITANISDSGVYAVVTKSSSYASVVSVYNRNNTLIYEWFSSEDTVNNVGIAPNGKKIAISAFNASTGAYNSKISILNFESANAEFTESYTGKWVYDIDTTHSTGFSVITDDTVRFIKWSDHKKTEYKNDYSVAHFRACKGGSVAVFNRVSDKTDNKIAVFTKKGKLKNEFAFKGIVSDVEVLGGNVYCISDTDVYILSDSGEVLRTAECGFGAVRLAVTGTNKVAVITDNRIDEIELEQK